jgi:acetyltransferase-like isoleucine patch superfamily enzyme
VSWLDLVASAFRTRTRWLPIARPSANGFKANDPTNLFVTDMVGRCTIMTGREIFRAFKPVVGLAVSAVRWLPRGLFSASWFLVESFPGRIGILLRYLYLARLSKSCGDNVSIGRRCTIQNWGGLQVGTNVTLHIGSYVDALGGISIGSNVSIAHSTSILSFEHTWEDVDTAIKYNPLRPEPVNIADDVWIGCGVRIMAGANIGPRTVIAAGAVVSRGSYARGVYGGVPAKLLKPLP